MFRVATGLDRIARGDSTALHGKRVGLVAHPASVDARLRHAIDLLHGAADVELVRLFGPEHGVRGAAQDMIAVDEHADPVTGLPVLSLYGSTLETLSPPPGALDGLDAVVFDLQDIGARYYTYIWTLLLTMRAAAGTGVQVIVLDRPNPLGGAVEGGAIEPGFESFVGLSSLPNRHGLTAAEVGRLCLSRESLDVELVVVEMAGWTRDMWFDQTGLPWVLPSPNMPTLETAIVYPGMCLIEGTEISEARGTTRPFEFVGAPYINGVELARRLESEALPGVAFRPMSFQPGFQKHAGELCHGVQLHVTDRDAFRPYLTGVAVVRAVAMGWPAEFDWRTRAYEFVDTIPAFDLLAGNSSVRDQIDRVDDLADIAGTWADAEHELATSLRRHHIYGGA